MGKNRAGCLRKTVTLIELIVVIIVMSIAIPTLIGLFTQANLNMVVPEQILTATFYAEELMEDIRKCSFDDVDSYNGYTDNPSSKYTRSVAVEYATLVDNAWQSSGGTPTDYKIITVSVKKAGEETDEASLILLVSNY